VAGADERPASVVATAELGFHPPVDVNHRSAVPVERVAGSGVSGRFGGGLLSELRRQWRGGDADNTLG
jgi:hypothetical protein